MKIEINKDIREIVADNSKFIARKGTNTYFKRCIMFNYDTLDDYNEITDKEFEEILETLKNL